MGVSPWNIVMVEEEAHQTAKQSFFPQKIRLAQRSSLKRAKLSVFSFAPDLLFARTIVKCQNKGQHSPLLVNNVWGTFAFLARQRLEVARVDSNSIFIKISRAYALKSYYLIHFLGVLQVIYC